MNENLQPVDRSEMLPLSPINQLRRTVVEMADQTDSGSIFTPNWGFVRLNSRKIMVAQIHDLENIARTYSSQREIFPSRLFELTVYDENFEVDESIVLTENDYDPAIAHKGEQVIDLTEPKTTNQYIIGFLDRQFNDQPDHDPKAGRVPRDSALGTTVSPT